MLMLSLMQEPRLPCKIIGNPHRRITITTMPIMSILTVSHHAAPYRRIKTDGSLRSEEGKLKNNKSPKCRKTGTWDFISIRYLHQMADEVLTVARQHVDDGNLDHRVAAGLETHGGASHVDEHLTGEGGVVDAHVEL